MRAARGLALGAAAGLAGVAYWRAMTRRNEALRRPPVRDARGLPLPGGRLRYSDGEYVEYVDAGGGDALVWVPGADGPKETYRHQLPRFAERYRVICADMRRGFAPGDDIDRLADDVAELAAARGAERFVLIGTSLGSAVAMRCASRWPGRVRGLALCNPLARVSREHVGLNRTLLIPLAMATTRYLPTELARALARRWSRMAVWVFDDSEGRDQLIEYALFTGPRTTPPSVSERRVDALRGLDLRSELPGLDVPALVVKGPRDAYCPPEWATEIADLLPRSEHVSIPGTGHCSHVSRPGPFNDALEDWLRRLPDGGDA